MRPLPLGAIRHSAVPRREFSATIAAFVETGPPVTAPGIVTGAALATGDGPDVGAAAAAAGVAAPNTGAATDAVVNGAVMAAGWSEVHADRTRSSAATTANRPPGVVGRAFVAYRGPCSPVRDGRTAGD